MVQETNSCELQVGETSIIVREMTVQQVRAFLQSAAKGENVDVVDGLLLGDCELGTLKAMSSITAEQIDQLRPSQLQAVKAKCKELNPDFFAMLTKLQGMA